MITTHGAHEVEREARRARERHKQDDVMRAGGPLFGGRHTAFGSRRKPPPASGATGQVTLNTFTTGQGSTDRTDGSMVETEINLGSGSNRVAVLFFSMVWNLGDGDPEPSSPPGDVLFGSGDMEFIAYIARSKIFHGYYWRAIPSTLNGNVNIRWFPTEPWPFWDIIFHVLVFNGAASSAPPIAAQLSGNEDTSSTGPYFSPPAATGTAGSWIMDSISTDDDRTPTIVPASTTHIRRTSTVRSSGLQPWRALCCAYEEHATPGFYNHPWWWTGGSQSFTYYAVEIVPAI